MRFARERGGGARQRRWLCSALFAALMLGAAPVSASDGTAGTALAYAPYYELGGVGGRSTQLDGANPVTFTGLRYYERRGSVMRTVLGILYALAAPSSGWRYEGTTYHPDYDVDWYRYHQVTADERKAHADLSERMMEEPTGLELEVFDNRLGGSLSGFDLVVHPWCWMPSLGDDGPPVLLDLGVHFRLHEAPGGRSTISNGIAFDATLPVVRYLQVQLGIHASFGEIEQPPDPGSELENKEALVLVHWRARPTINITNHAYAHGLVSGDIANGRTLESVSVGGGLRF